MTVDLRVGGGISSQEGVGHSTQGPGPESDRLLIVLHNSLGQLARKSSRLWLGVFTAVLVVIHSCKRFETYCNLCLHSEGIVKWQKKCRDVVYHLQAAPDVQGRRWCSSCREYHDKFENGEGWAYAPFGAFTPSSMIVYYCFFLGTVYDITPAAHALRLRGKVLDGSHFKVTTSHQSQTQGRQAQRTSCRKMSAAEIARKAGNRSQCPRRRGKQRKPTKKHGQQVPASASVPL